MGLDIKRNAKGKFSLSSTISGESLHPKKKWITEAEAKKILIIGKLYEFIEKVVNIDMEFPMRYRVNDVYCNDKKPSFLEWWGNTNYSDEELIKKLNEVLIRLDITIDFTTEKDNEEVK